MHMYMPNVLINFKKIMNFINKLEMSYIMKLAFRA